MIEKEDMATTPRPITQDTIDTSFNTIQVPATQEATIPTANPFIDVDDLLALKVVSDPQISPDGSLIAYTVLQCDEETNTTSSAIWLIHSKDSKAQTPRQLTGTGSNKHLDFAPRWSPDGQSLAFLSDRNGSARQSPPQPALSRLRTVTAARFAKAAFCSRAARRGGHHNRTRGRMSRTRL